MKNNPYFQEHSPASINCKGELILLDTPKVMGVLNLTPDSFYDGGLYRDEKAILDQTEKMIREGASFIDLGAYSSKPGAALVSSEEESRRLLPVLELLLREFPEALFSIDTFRSDIAMAAGERGAALINDISAGLLDPNMMPTVAALGLPYIMMHMRGTPQTMKDQTQYKHLMQEILQYFSQRISTAKSYGLYDLIIDPGYGFSKTTTQNFQLLKQAAQLNSLDLPVLTGVSRKSMIYKTLDIGPKEALNGTTALHMQALLSGSKILRVHDVKEAMECVSLFNALEKAT
ncbi:dihydropteroate synthase [Flavobacteriaceae bacterium LSUCC0859]|nr:dihydropteroate synthase [Flavobacteriaceae bacterium LSUCC0859]